MTEPSGPGMDEAVEAQAQRWARWLAHLIDAQVRAARADERAKVLQEVEAALVSESATTKYLDFRHGINRAREVIRRRVTGVSQ